MLDWRDGLSILFLILVVIGTIMLFIRLFTSTGRNYARSLKNAQAEQENRSRYLSQNLEEIRRQNVILERIADALDRAHPTQPDATSKYDTAK
jgi:hypothetical protein